MPFLFLVLFLYTAHWFLLAFWAFLLLCSSGLTLPLKYLKSTIKMVDTPADQQLDRRRWRHCTYLLFPSVGGGSRADALLLWSKAAFVSMNIPKSKNFSVALILPKFQRGRASRPREVWRSGGTHCSPLALLSFCACVGSRKSCGPRTYRLERCRQQPSLFFLQESGWWGQNVALALFKRRTWFCPGPTYIKHLVSN